MTRQTAFDFPARRRDPVATFVPGEATTQVRAALGAWRDWPGRALALVGPAASGKTHLAAMWSRDSGAAIVHPETSSGVIDVVRAGPVVLEGADTVDDDLLRIRALDVAKEDGGGPLLLTSRLAPGDWATSSPDLKSRLRALAYIELSDPSDGELSGVLTKLFADRGLEAEPGVVEYILRRIDRSYAAAATLVAELDRRSLERKRPVTRRLAGEVLADQSDDRR